MEDAYKPRGVPFITEMLYELKQLGFPAFHINAPRFSLTQIERPRISNACDVRRQFIDINEPVFRE